VSHAYLLAGILVARGHDAKTITGETPIARRERYIRQFKKDNPHRMVLCNYGVLTTGFDAPKTSAAVIARPTRSLVLYSQMVGRAIRGPRANGNHEAEIVTVVDTTLPGFGSVTDAFKNWEDVWDEHE
jgi:superfamily II DNA or RNA helicase